MQMSMQSTSSSINTSGYGVVPTDTINTGFRTALKVYEEMPFVSPTMKTLSETQHTEIPKRGVDKRSKRQVAGQGSITTFFNKAGPQQQDQVAMTCGHNLPSTKLPIAPEQEQKRKF